jgi:DMSO/TMAO reductase YedYZ heme-binding membrane subunit
MEKAPNIWEFLEGNKQQLNEYIELRVQLFSLQLIRKTSTVTAMLLWLAVIGVICFLITIFAGLTLGFYLALVFNSFVTGFGVTTLIILFIALIVILLRKQLFINPIIRIIIREQTRDYEPE